MLFNSTRLRHHHADDHDHDCLGTHDHTHPHTHRISQENKDEEILKISLVHWINQNNKQQEEYTEWANKAREIGKEETENSIKKAAEYMKKASEMLIEAKKTLNKI